MPMSQKKYEGILVSHSGKYGTLIIDWNSYFESPQPTLPVITCPWFKHNTLHDTWYLQFERRLRHSCIIRSATQPVNSTTTPTVQYNIPLNSLYMYIHPLKHSETVQTTSHAIQTLCLLLTHSVSYNAATRNNYISKQT
jgi:hypothetical protein